MRALLNNLLIAFAADDTRLLAGWAQLFDREIALAARLPSDRGPDITLSAAVVARLPAVPQRAPRSQTETGVTFFDSAAGGILRLVRPAQITFNFAQSEAAVSLTAPLLAAGSLEDITMIALAPFLRRHGYHMVHAFAAASGTAVLLCGPSGSGKTTTGLALLQHGWRYLANDVTLLREEQGRVQACPSPGAVNIHPHSLDLLPQYGRRLGETRTANVSEKYLLPRTALLGDAVAQSPAVVSAILFPSIAAGDALQISKLPSAIGLARLIEESVDRWDEAAVADHLDLLALVSRQAQFFDLQMPQGGAGSLASASAELSARLSQ